MKPSQYIAIVLIALVVLAVIIAIVLTLIHLVRTVRVRRQVLPSTSRRIRLKAPRTRPWIAGDWNRSIKMKNDDQP
jgi:hypothetical protein